VKRRAGTELTGYTPHFENPIRTETHSGKSCCIVERTKETVPTKPKHPNPRQAKTTNQQPQTMKQSIE